jgi:CheY-like chemotaxis protein
MKDMSYEIRSSMNVIMGVAESYLGNDTLTDEVRDGFEKIYNEGNILLRSLNIVLEPNTAPESEAVERAEKKKKVIREPMPYGKVLIVDDMVSNLDVAKLLLKPYQLQIDSAGSGSQAIKMIKSGKEYDIVFMDHMMPEMDGMETVKTLRKSGYKHPIIALTANTAKGQADIFLENGFDGYISKPIDIRQLNDSLNKFVRDRARI